MSIARHPVFHKSVTELVVDILVFAEEAEDLKKVRRSHIGYNPTILGWKMNQRWPTPSKAEAAHLRLLYQNDTEGRVCNGRMYADTAIRSFPKLETIRVSYDLGQGCYRRGPLSWGMSCAAKRHEEKSFKLLTKSSLRYSPRFRPTGPNAAVPMYSYRFSPAPRCHHLSWSGIHSDPIRQRTVAICEALKYFEFEYSIMSNMPMSAVAGPLRILLSHAKNLVNIKMNFPWCPEELNCVKGWKPGVWDLLARNLWSKLRVLHLGGLFVREKALTEFLVSHQALEELILWSVEIRDGTWINVARELHEKLHLRGVRLIHISQIWQRLPTEWHRYSDEVNNMEQLILGGRANSLGSSKDWWSTVPEKPLRSHSKSGTSNQNRSRGYRV